MAQNSKIIFYGETLMDLTGDTVEADKLLKGITAHNKEGDLITGTCEFDSDTSDADASTSEILEGKTVYARGQKITGEMPNKGEVILTISGKDDEVPIPLGFHDGSGKAVIDEDEKVKLLPGNIKNGITILGVEGTMTGREDLEIQQKEITPKKTVQIVTPDEGKDYLSQVTVNGVPVTVTDNAAGGKTVMIGEADTSA